ncbi:MATE family efflux transporter [Bythopirellula polymerisocia]|uniref:Multidrug-efflux transporter n=1 Tax=Bythopirellula polymerisocia TaxID=2528003 RepID=A0A5C6CG11_9BACT|nr:MATE family efflux transporter [Bythopirellula polymerisocia]TWU22647.1 Multidrug resistance protein NorM [Bythopirellula polymerisocia]
MTFSTNTQPESLSWHKRWWLRECGGREVLQIALPMVVSTMSWTVMTYVDRAMLAHYSPIAMTAAFSAGVLWFALFCIFLGICSYVCTFVSQYHGDEQPERIGPVVWQGNWLALVSVPLALAAIPLAPWIFSLAKHRPEVTEQEIRYFKILCLGGPGMVLATSFSCFYSGRGMTWVTMVVDLIGTAVNLLLDYFLIFGYAGFPEMGIAGAAWATVVGIWIKPFIFFALMWQQTNRITFHTDNWRLDLPLLRRLIYYGGPGGMQMLLDITGFTIFIILVGRLGDMPAMASSMAFSINTVSFMPVWGLGMSAGILVGQHLGENRDDLAARATWTTYQIGMAYMALLTVMYVTLPDLFLTSFIKGTTQPELYQMALMLLYFVAAYNAFDTTQIIFVSALKGSGDTRFIMGVSLIMATTLAALTYLAVEVLHLDVYACWVIIVFWLTILAVTYLFRFIGGKWRTMRVIEQIHHPQPESCEIAVPEACPEAAHVLEEGAPV